MDATRILGRGWRFSLRTMFVAVVLALLACGFAVQQRRIQILTAERIGAETNRRIMLFHVLGAAAAPRIAGFIGGEYVELSETIKITDRRNQLHVDAGENSLVANVNGRTIHCTTFTFDPKSGQFETDAPQFFERLGMDFDFSAK